MSGITSELNSINLSATTNQIHSASTDSEVPHIQSLINSYQPLSALLRRDLAGQDDETQTPELEKVSISNYEQESNEKNRAEEIKLFKEKMLAEMQETGELVEKDHPLYQEMHGILEQLRPGTKVDLHLSASDELKAFTLVDNETMVISAGLLSKLKQFTLERGTQVTRGHMAFIFAHEYSHWDPEAKAFHLNETYCDTNGLMMCNDSLFSTDDAVMALEFLEWIEDKHKEETIAEQEASEADKSMRIPLTHPSSESRRVLGMVIANDPDIHLDGRYVEAEPLNVEALDDFLKLSESWQQRQEERFSIGSETAIDEQLDKANTASEIFETFLSADEFYHARLSQEFSESEDFGNITLALALYVEMQGSSPYASEGLSISHSDFYAQIRGNKIQPSAERPERKESDNDPAPEIRVRESWVTGRPLTQEQRNLLERCLKGEFGNGLEVLTLSSEQMKSQFPDLQNYNFNTFFSGLAKDTHGYLHDKSMHNEAPGALVERLQGLGFEEDIDTQSYVADNEISDKTSDKRSALIRSIKTALASSFIRAQLTSNRYSPSFEFNNFVDAAISKQKQLLPNYGQLHQRLTERLFESGSCETIEVAHDLALMIVATGKFVNSPEPYKGSWKEGVDFRHTIFASYDSGNQAVQKDIRENIFGKHLALVLGGQKILQQHGEVSIDGFNKQMNYFYGSLVGQEKILIGNQYIDPYSIYETSLPSVTCPKQPYNKEDINFYNELFTTWRGEYAKCRSTDPEVLYRLLTTSVQNRRNTIGAILANAEIAANLELIESLLQRGIQERSLRVKDINVLLEKSENIDLHKRYLPYIASQNNFLFFQRYYSEFLSRDEIKLLRKSEQIRLFVLEGGVVSNGCDNYIFDQVGVNVLEYTLGQDNTNFTLNHREDPDFTHLEAANLAVELMKVAHSQDFPYEEKERESLINTAAALIRYSQELTHYPDEWVSRMEKSEIPSTIEKIAKIPESSYRDMYVIGILRVVPEDDIETRIRCFSLLSQQKVRSLDIDKIPAGIVMNKPLTTLPLSEGATDIAEYFTFFNGDNDLLNEIEKLAKAIDQKKELEGIKDPLLQLDLIGNAVHYGSGIRDYLIERVLLTYLKGETTIDTESRIKLFQKAHLLATNQRTKEALAGELLRSRLDGLGTESTYRERLAAILDVMPNASANRDQFIIEALNNTYTSWEEIAQAQELVLGHNYRTDTTASKVRSGIQEALSYGIESLGVKEKVEFITFLLDVSKHVVKISDINEAFFTRHVEEKLKQRLIGEHYLGWKKETKEQKRYGWEDLEPSEIITEEDVEQNIVEIRKFLMSRFGSSTMDELSIRRARFGLDQGALPRSLYAVLSEISPGELLALATPDPLNKFINEQLGTYGSNMSATSLGSLFLNHNRSERRQIVYRLCLGDTGFFENREFDQHGIQVLDALVDIATNVQANNSTKWTDDEKMVAKTVVKEVFRAMDPSRRTEVFSRVINLIAESGGAVSKEELVKIALSSFGIVGAKIGQMDELLPEWMRESLSSLKEDVPPIPKPTVARILKADGRDQEYEGLGAFIAGGSTAIVLSGERVTEDGQEDRIIKMIRPDIKKNLQGDIQAAFAAIKSLNEGGVLNVDPTQIITELVQMIGEELDPSYEGAHMKIMRVSRKRITASQVGTPELLHQGKDYIEITRAQGISLNKLEQIREKVSRNEPLSPEEQKYADLNDEELYREVFADFMAQVKTGMFHTDLHLGNIFTNTQGQITEIDYGQVGIEDSIEKRNALYKYTIGIAINNTKLVTKALQEFNPSITEQEVIDYAKQTGSLVNGITKLVSDKNVEGSINRFTKALVNMYPCIQRLKPATIFNIMRPYMASKAVVFDIMRAIPSVISGRARRIFARA